MPNRGRPPGRTIRPMSHIVNDDCSGMISGPPIPEDLFWFYKQAMIGEAAVCVWSDAGAKNSRWINVQERLGHSLLNLIERIARLEIGLADVVEALESDKEFRHQYKIKPDNATVRLHQQVNDLVFKCLEDARSFRQSYRRELGRRDGQTNDKDDKDDAVVSEVGDTIATSATSANSDNRLNQDRRTSARRSTSLLIEASRDRQTQYKIEDKHGNQ